MKPKLDRCSKTVNEMTEIMSNAAKLMLIFGLAAPPVGVRFLRSDQSMPEKTIRLNRHRYCQALMRARDGESVLLDADGISCPAAAAAFGFRPLPENLQNGKGLVGFGIVQKQATGQRMFAEMSYLLPGAIAALHIYPLDQSHEDPDVIVIEDEVEKLMWISLAYLNITGGQRVQSSTAVLQATCVDATIIPWQEQRLNHCFGCYGCRDATNLGSSEAVLGFPGNLLPEMSEAIAFLNQKTIPTSRAKKAYSALSA
jgi:uncharacterized protein (DUF169 family)